MFDELKQALHDQDYAHFVELLETEMERRDDFGDIDWLLPELNISEEVALVAALLSHAEKVADSEESEWVASLLGYAGIYHANCKDYDRALELFDVSLGVFRLVGSDDGVAAELRNMAAVHNARGEFDRARELYGQAEEVYTSRNYNLAPDQDNAHKLHQHVEEAEPTLDNDPALDCFAQIIGVLGQAGDPRLAAELLRDTGIMYEKRSDYDTALEKHTQSLELYRRSGDEHGEAAALIYMANIYSTRGSYDRALMLYEQSLKVYRRVGDEHGAAQTLMGMGGVYSSSCEYDKALELYEQSLEVFFRVGDEHGAAQTLVNMGGVCSSRCEYDKALELYEQSLEVFHRIGDEYSSALTIRNMGHVSVSRGEYDRALELYGESLKVSHRLGNEHNVAKTLQGMGAVHRYRGNYDRALELYEQSLDVYRRVGDEHGAAATLGNMGNVHNFRGDFVGALELYEQSLEVLRRIGDEHGAAQALYNMSNVHRSRGDYDAALAMCEQSLAVMQRLGDEHGAAAALMGMGNVHSSRGDYDRALELYEQSLEVLRRAGDEHGAATLLMNIGIVYASREDYDSATEAYSSCLEIMWSVGDEHGAAKILNNLGNMYAFCKDYDDALIVYEQSLAILRSVGDERGTAQTLHNIGNVHSARGNFSLAKVLYEQCLEVERRVGDQHGTAKTLHNIGNVFYKRSDYDQALALYQQSLEVACRLEDYPGAASTLDEMAGCHVAQSRYQTAEVLYQEAVEISERFEAGLLIESQDAWRKTYRYRVIKYIDCLLHNEKEGTALEMAEKFRCEELVAQLQEQLLPETQYTPEEQNTNRQYHERISWLISQLDDGGDLLGAKRTLQAPESFSKADVTTEQRKQYSAELQALGQKLHALQLKYLPSFVNSRHLSPLKDLQKALMSRQAAVEFCAIPDGIALFVLTKQACTAERIGIKREELTPLVDQARNAVANQSAAELSTDSREALHQMYRLLLAPAIAHLSSRKKPLDLVIVPSGELANIPWAALIVDNSGPWPVYLADIATIRIVPSLQILAYIRKQESAADPVQLNSVLCIADPVGHFQRIQHSSEEAAGIAKLAKQRNGVHLRKDALKHYLDNTEEWEVVHLATHGSFNELLPEESGILFSPSDPKEAELLEREQLVSLKRGGRSCLPAALSADDLTVSDVMKLKLTKTKLLTLSACEVGQVRSEALEQFQGMVAAVVFAGCPNTIAALWGVDDERTKDLMLLFYRKLREAADAGQQLGVAEALRQASIAFRDEHTRGGKVAGPNSHPYYWAAFQVYGCG